jgi:hypothetical protein
MISYVETVCSSATIVEDYKKRTSSDAESPNTSFETVGSETDFENEEIETDDDIEVEIIDLDQLELLQEEEYDVKIENISQGSTCSHRASKPKFKLQKLLQKLSYPRLFIRQSETTTKKKPKKKVSFNEQVKEYDMDEYMSRMMKVRENLLTCNCFVHKNRARLAKFFSKYCILKFE